MRRGLYYGKPKHEIRYLGNFNFACTQGTFAADDLRRSRLTPGVPFLYCVRAIGVIANSDPTCVEHIVRWETAVELSVALPPTSGNIPSENVLVTYQLEDASGTPIVDAFGVTQANVTTTQPDGKAQLAFSFVPASAFQVDILNLRFTLVKQTNTGNGTITHQFLCDGGSAPCSSEGNIFPVQNLVFSHEIEVQDMTSVPIEGLVLIGDSGCPLQGAEVCVNAKAGLNQVNIACVQTDFAGRFAVGSVIGARTVVEVTYKEHTFVLSDGAPEVVQANGANGEGDGFIASADKRFTGLVFQDTTTAEITVDVVGGLCNRHLGESTVKYQIRGCSAFQEIFPPQQETREQYVVYAHAIEVGAEVYGNVDLEPQVVDLTDDFSNSTDPSTSGDTSNEEDITGLGDRYLRFQFDGTFSVSIVNPISPVPRCSQVLTFRAGALANALITVKESFPPRHVIGGEVADCTTFADDARVVITNKLGVDLEDPKDAQFFDRFKAEDPPAVALELLTLCSNPSLNSRCSAPLIYDTVPGLGEVNGRVLFPLLVGPPNTISPFTKVFTAEFRPRPNALGVQETIQPVIVGDYEEGLVEAVDVPVYEPVMILRDPPGGNSYVTYENVETTIEVTHETFMAKTSNGTYLTSTFQTGFFFELCTKEFFGIELCTNFAGASNSEFKSESEPVIFDPVSYKDKANTIELSTKWTYSTSNSPWTAGQASDVFVVPSIKLALEVVDQVSLDESCVAQVDRLQKFSGAEDLSVSFLTYDDIVSFTFNETIEQLQNGLEQEPTSEGKDNIRDAIASTRQAIESWEKVLNEYRATNADAEAGVNVLKPYAFFGNISAFSGLGNQYAGLLPKTLVEGAIPLPSTDVANTDLDAIDTITFTGGGSSLSFSLSSETMESNGRLEGVNEVTEDSFSGGIGFRLFIPAVHTRVIFGRTSKLQVKEGLTISDIAKTDTRVTFHLGDTDAGDRFDVKIAMDPKFKSFIFVTQSTSRSMCPHEPGTVPRENTRLEVLPTSTSSPLLPDEPVVFNLRLTNTGEDESNFLLAIDQKTNPDGLTFNLNSGVVPINFLPGKSSVDFLLEVKRGPIQFEYAAVNVSFRSACEFTSNTLSNDDFPASEIIKRTQTTEQLFNDAATGKIVFAEPCPTIELAQPDPRNRAFINIASGGALEFIVRNPRIAKRGSLFQQVADTRLNSVKLKFRNVQRPRQILPAFASPLTDLDFADEASEDDLGFSRAVWNIETNGVIDGVYEVWAEADCETVLGAPPGFNTAPSATLKLVVDRTIPRLFEQKPPAGEVVIGQSVVFVFTENIDCNSFRIDAQVEGIATGFNNHLQDNLLLLCAENEIAFQFDPLEVDYAELVGKKFDVVVSSVSDLSGNELVADIVANLSYATLNLDLVGVQFDLILQRNCTVDATSIQAEIAAVIGVELSRIAVQSISCIPTGVLLTVSILPAEDSGSTNTTERRLSEIERMAPLSLLYAMAGGGIKERRNLQGFAAIDQMDGYVAIQGVHINDPTATATQSQTIYLETDKAKIADVERQVGTTAALYVQQQQGLEDLKQLVIGATAVLGVLIAALIVVVGSNGVRMRRSRGALVAENYSSASGMSSTNPTYQRHVPAGPTKVEA